MRSSSDSASLSKSSGNSIVLFVQLDLCVDVFRADSVTCRCKVTQAVSVDFETELDLRGDLVALGYRDLAHIVAKPRYLEVLGLVPAHGGADPVIGQLLDFFRLPVADHDLAFDAHAGADVAELTIAVSALVQVHVVHVDAGPGQFGAELGMQVHPRLVQGLEAIDPHLGRAEGVHPENQADAISIAVGLLADLQDFSRRGHHALGQHRGGYQLGRRKAIGDGLAVLGHLLQDLGTVKVL